MKASHSNCTLGAGEHHNLHYHQAKHTCTSLSFNYHHTKRARSSIPLAFKRLASPPPIRTVLRISPSCPVPHLNFPSPFNHARVAPDFRSVLSTRSCYGSQAPPSSPLSEQRHEGGPCQNTQDHESQSLVVLGSHRVEQEVSGEQFNEASIYEDPGAHAVQNAGYHVRCETAGVVCCPQAETDGNGYWCG